MDRKASGIILIKCNLLLVCNKKRHANKIKKVTEIFQINQREGKDALTTSVIFD